MEIKVGVVCDRGLNPKRPVNQDSYLALAAHGLFAVFDGVGGQQAGEVASRMAAETIEEALADVGVSLSPDGIRRAVQFANRDIYEHAESDPAYKTMATTVALLQIEGNRAILAHVGDSRIYRLEDGYLYRETIDHTDYHDALRAGVALTGTGAGGNIINRALGVEADVEVELKIIDVSDGTRLLLCSDGIYRHLADEEIASVLAQTKDPQAAADELKRQVLARGADDNLTAIVVQVGRARVGRVIGVDDGLGEYRNQPPLSAAAGRVSASSAGSAVTHPTESRRTTTPVTANRRIEVALQAQEAKPDDSPWDWQSKPQASLSDAAEPAPRRTLVWVLALLVGVAAAFYAGLRASEWFAGKPSSAPAPTDSAGKIRGAREAFERGDRLTAAAELERLVAGEPQNADARFWLGRVQLEQGEYAKARENFDEAIRAQPKLTDAYLYAAAAHRALGERGRADALLERYLEARKQSR